MLSPHVPGNVVETHRKREDLDSLREGLVRLLLANPLWRRQIESRCPRDRDSDFRSRPVQPLRYSLRAERNWRYRGDLRFSCALGGLWSAFLGNLEGCQAVLLV